MAKFIVTGEEVDGIDRKMCEIKRQLRQRSGSPLDPKLVNFALQEILEPGYGAKKGIGLQDPPVILETLRASGYLDTSFEGKEVHRLVIDPLSRGEAFAAYRASGGKTWIWDELEKNIPYTVPKAGILDVFILGFGKAIGSDEGVALMDELGVRPLVFEEHLQLGIKKPTYQEKNPLIALTKYSLGGIPYAPVLIVIDGERTLSADGLCRTLDVRCRFPVVCKEKPGNYNYLLDS